MVLNPFLRDTHPSPEIWGHLVANYPRRVKVAEKTPVIYMGFL